MSTTRVPHCPRCGNGWTPESATHKFHGYCNACWFNGGKDSHGVYLAHMPWDVAIRRELAEQALALRTHGRGHGQFMPPLVFADAMERVKNDYAWLGAHPLLLPNETDQ